MPGTKHQTEALVLLLALLLWGLVAGWLANMLLGGGMRTDNWGELLIAGTVGSFVGGLLASLIAGDGLALRPSGIIGSIIGAVVVLASARWWSQRSA
jgi:uncharacterized membrane protein YeaQ/YmgE (transglycosylase-associated protein family)